MLLTGLVITLLSDLISGVQSIECYSCYVKPPPRSPFAPAPEFEPLCSKFDASDSFLVNCTQSTFCMTRTYRLHLRQGSPVVIQERGCAKQVYSYQDLDRGQWRTITTIVEETYKSGCVRDKEWAGSLATDTEWCYCDSDRCNHTSDQEDGEDSEDDLPQYSDYQDNFIDHNGLRISSPVQNVADLNFYNITKSYGNSSVRITLNSFFLLLYFFEIYR